MYNLFGAICCRYIWFYYIGILSFSWSFTSNTLSEIVQNPFTIFAVCWSKIVPKPSFTFLPLSRLHNRLSKWLYVHLNTCPPAPGHRISLMAKMLTINGTISFMMFPRFPFCLCILTFHLPMRKLCLTFSFNMHIVSWWWSSITCSSCCSLPDSIGIPNNVVNLLALIVYGI